MVETKVSRIFSENRNLRKYYFQVLLLSNSQHLLPNHESSFDVRFQVEQRPRYHCFDVEP